MKKLNILIKLIAIISSIYGMIKSYAGPITFTYFTILSNIFITIMLIIFLIKEIINIKLSNTFYITKFLATISITLTFFVFLTLLAPTYPTGIIDAYIGKDASSLCVHFITPILAIIDFLFFNNEYKSKSIHTIYAVIPPLLYVAFILILGGLGVRWGTMYAPYNFLNYNAKTGWFGFDTSIMGWETLGIGVAYMIIILLIIFIIIGRIFLKIKEIIKD